MVLLDREKEPEDVDLETVVKALSLKIRSGGDKLKTQILGGYTGDLLSDVMANSKEGDIWITRQVHQNIVAVASLKELAGIILVQGSEPAKDTLDKAQKEDIPIMISDLSAFEVAGRINDLMKKNN
jgi:predicted transcriptional regulator